MGLEKISSKRAEGKKITLEPGDYTWTETPWSPFKTMLTHSYKATLHATRWVSEGEKVTLTVYNEKVDGRDWFRPAKTYAVNVKAGKLKKL